LVVPIWTDRSIHHLFQNYFVSIFNIKSKLKADNMHKYNFGPISIIFLVLYFLIISFVKSGKLSLVNNHKIWNYMLLISFIISGTLGMVLLLPNHGIELPYKDDLLALHVQTGIVMTYCSFVHFMRHKQYYRIKKDRNHA
jgi:hypothetical protein